MKSVFLFLIIVCTTLPQVLFAQTGKPIIYFSWGYNKEWYTKSDIHIKQTALGNDYTFKDVIGIDKPGWNTGILNKELTIPQYNVRLGIFFRNNPNWGFELNFDHTKYQVQQNQNLHIVGTLNNAPADFFKVNSNERILTYQLNNGANFFLFNIMRRSTLYEKEKYFSLDAIIKAGVGFVYPHVENTILGFDNNSGFQFGGFDAGIEAGFKANFFKYYFVEFTNKLVQANYFNLNIYKGTSKQQFLCYQLILNVGINICLPEKDKPTPLETPNIKNTK